MHSIPSSWLLVTMLNSTGLISNLQIKELVLRLQLAFMHVTPHPFTFYQLSFCLTVLYHVVRDGNLETSQLLLSAKPARRLSCLSSMISPSLSQAEHSQSHLVLLMSRNTFQKYFCITLHIIRKADWSVAL